MTLELDDLGPEPLRSRLLEALLQACTEAIEAGEAAPAAYLLRGRVYKALEDPAAALKDFQAAAASQDSRVMYEAAQEAVKLDPELFFPVEYLLELQHSSPAEAAELDVAIAIRNRAVQSAPSGPRVGYTAAINRWFRALPSSGAALHATADQITLWVRAGFHKGSSNERILRSLELFYTEAEKLGYPNPMPEVRELLRGASSPGVAHHSGEVQT